MYVAPHAREDRSEILRAAIAEIQFGVLVTGDTGALDASHLPMIVREEEGGALLIEGHVSRANPLAEISDGSAGLAIFQGPQAYIHPGWYPSKARDGRAVPTWNYIAVHAHGLLTTHRDPAWLRPHLEALTARNEAHRADAWAVGDAPPDYVAALMNGIVGLTLRVDRLEGNWKMAQKQPLENRLGAARGLSKSADAGDRAVAEIMERLAAARG